MKKKQYVVEQLPDGHWVYDRELAQSYKQENYNTKEEAEKALLKLEQFNFRRHVAPKMAEKLVTKALRKKTIGIPDGSLLGLEGEVLIGGGNEHWIYHYFGDGDHWFALSGPCGTIYSNALVWDWKSAPGKVPCKSTVNYALYDEDARHENNAAGVLARPKLHAWIAKPEVVAMVEKLYMRLRLEGEKAANEPGEKQC